jgi:PAS domain S-box-containing protein
MEILRTLILGIGWPILIVGSFYVTRQSVQFFRDTGKTTFGKLAVSMTTGWLITMYSLGIVSTLFMFKNPSIGVPIVLPIFIIWFICMIYLVRAIFHWISTAPLIMKLDKAKETKLLEEIVEHAPIGIYTVNHEGIVDSFNPKMVEIAGANKAEDVIGLNVFSMQSYKEVGLDTLFREGLKGKAFELETQYTTQTGKKVTWRHYRGVPLLLSDNKTVERLLLLVSDITQRKELEERLRENAKKLETEILERTKTLEYLKEQYRSVLEGSLVGIYVLQGDIYEYVNPVFVHIFGYDKAEEIVGKSWQELVYKDDIPLVISNGIEERLRGQGKAVRYSYRGLKKDKTVIEVEVLSNPSTFEGKPGIIGSLQDISERKQMENSIQKHVAELERMNKLMVDRELKMVELKKDLEELQKKIS